MSQFLDALHDCKDIAKQVGDKSDTEAASILSSIAISVQQRTLELGKLFRGKGQARVTGTLPFPQVVWKCLQSLSCWLSNLHIHVHLHVFEAAA
jgi:hypothetical protein